MDTLLNKRQPSGFKLPIADCQLPIEVQNRQLAIGNWQYKGLHGVQRTLESLDPPAMVPVAVYLQA